MRVAIEIHSQTNGAKYRTFDKPSEQATELRVYYTCEVCSLLCLSNNQVLLLLPLLFTGNLSVYLHSLVGRCGVEVFIPAAPPK
jgi:hypothetical protein